MLIHLKTNPQTTATHINVIINKKKKRAVLDSGAESTLVDFKTAKELNLIIQPMDDSWNTVYVAANGGDLKILGWSLMEVTLGSYTVRQKCIIINNLSTEVLLGTDMLVDHGMILNYRERTVTIGKVCLPMHTEKKQSNFCLATSSHIEIKPLATHIEWVYVPEHFKETLLIQSLPMSNVRIRNGLFDSREGKVPLIITNNRRCPVVIEKGIHLANVEKVDIVERKYISTAVNKQLTKIQLDIMKQVQASDLIKTNKKLTSEQKTQLDALANKYDHVFSKHKNDLGMYDKLKFEIDTGDARPIKSRAYRAPHAQLENIENLIDEMLENKIVSPSNSPWASPVVIIKKKDGTDRFCIDYRKLNNLTVKDNYPIPMISETLDSMKGSFFFTTLDLASGYWQMALDEASKLKTAFISSKGLFHFNKLPFGLSNAVAGFQRAMVQILEGLTFAKVYLDDIMIHSTNFVEHLFHLEEVFKRLEEAGLKIKPSKCNFAANETTYLGFDIDSVGIRPSKDKTKCVDNYPKPHNAKSVKKFLGLTSYYRKFIRDYTRLSDPINRLLKKGKEFVWSKECDTSFHALIDHLVNPPILVYPDFEKDFILTTDASKIGLGAVLSQLDKYQHERVIGYGSRTLNPAEKNYAARELECLGIVWAIGHFRHYLYGKKFKIYCDHNPLQYLDNMKNNSSKVNRWRLEMAEYDKEIVYKPGVKNTNADALSRIEEPTESIVNSVHTYVRKTNVAPGCTHIFSRSQKIEKINIIQSSSQMLLPKKIIEAQSADPLLKGIIDAIKTRGSHSDYFLKHDILYKYSHKVNKDLLVIADSMKDLVFEMCHNDMGGGHLGFKKTWPKIRDRFYWKNMYNDTDDYLKRCVACAKRKTPACTRTHLNPINEASMPFDMMGVDILGPLKKTINGNQYCLVFTDYLTRWPEVFPMKNMKAETIAKIFVDEIISRHSAPKILLSDQGAQFMSNLIKSISNYLIIKKINTTAYHPQTNGLTERFNATLCQILSMYSEENQSNWDDLLPVALFAYRTSQHETTLQSPFVTLYNREPRLPNMLETVRIEDKFVKNFDKNWKMAKQRIKKVNDARKLRYDNDKKEKIINIGDNVRILSLATKVGLKTKLRGDLWNGPFRVKGKTKHGGLKIDTFKKELYICNPNRCKIAEPYFDKRDVIYKSSHNRKVTFIEGLFMKNHNKSNNTSHIFKSCISHKLPILFSSSINKSDILNKNQPKHEIEKQSPKMYQRNNLVRQLNASSASTEYYHYDAHVFNQKSSEEKAQEKLKRKYSHLVDQHATTASTSLARHERRAYAKIQDRVEAQKAIVKSGVYPKVTASFQFSVKPDLRKTKERFRKRDKAFKKLEKERQLLDKDKTQATVDAPIPFRKRSDGRGWEPILPLSDSEIISETIDKEYNEKISSLSKIVHLDVHELERKMDKSTKKMKTPKRQPIFKSREFISSSESSDAESDPALVINDSE